MIRVSDSNDEFCLPFQFKSLLNQGGFKTVQGGGWFQIFFISTPTWGRFPFWQISLNWVETTNQCCFFGKGGISGRFGKMFSRSAGTFNTRYLMTQRYPRKYELSCVFQDSSISHYYLLNLIVMYSHFLNFRILVDFTLLLYISYKQKIQPNPNPNTSHPGEPPQFFQVPGFPKSPLEPGEFGSEVFHSALCLLAGTFRGHLRGCGTSRRSPVTWWMDGWWRGGGW